ncbi:YvrJ family protein [Atopobacter sp. AH10]|uniref:YvrJ family protein n=1 Tax=Atopobacter sp. AH10 TaxID=2315861 RepID=UPI000EF27525|nr:YvrJ family protein [Atopobacter sp. AH10]RLK64274.1 YvrJ family protein [Atopobacter sp. AH10]
MPDPSIYIDLIGNLGFPIVIVFYLIFRFETRLDKIIHLLEDGLQQLFPLLQAKTPA